MEGIISNAEIQKILQKCDPDLSLDFINTRVCVNVCRLTVVTSKCVRGAADICILLCFCLRYQSVLFLKLFKKAKKYFKMKGCCYQFGLEVCVTFYTVFVVNNLILKSCSCLMAWDPPACIHNRNVAPLWLFGVSPYFHWISQQFTIKHLFMYSCHTQVQESLLSEDTQPQKEAEKKVLKF